MENAVKGTACWLRPAVSKEGRILSGKAKKTANESW